MLAVRLVFRAEYIPSPIQHVSTTADSPHSSFPITKPPNNTTNKFSQNDPAIAEMARNFMGGMGGQGGAGRGQ